ncbi:centromere protein P [Rhinatrema bivittatum]|uniref:centromere protein P n=1 Tax=Rhinatrema bivittatum TaxID=194408 RepID=UPI00112BC23D|nr:centromere protein P [Rhinatrema bivittatum]
MEKSLYEVYEDEIRTLEKEIEELTEQYEENQQNGQLAKEEIEKAIKLYRGKTITKTRTPESVADIKSQLEQLESELSFLTKLSGIEFTTYSKQTVEKDENKYKEKHRITGNCYLLPFQIEFVLLKVENKESTSSVVTNLSIILESGENSDFSKFVSRAEERKNLLGFFRSLSSFAEWCNCRHRTFLHFKGRYPEIVGLPEGSLADYMVLRNPELSGCELIVVWKIQVNEEGTVTPVLDLLTKIPEQALRLDKNKVRERTPLCFRNLLRVFGIETAIANVIKAFCMEEQVCY